LLPVALLVLFAALDYFAGFLLRAALLAVPILVRIISRMFVATAKTDEGQTKTLIVDYNKGVFIRWRVAVDQLWEG
jgi:hypothetical protein